MPLADHIVYLAFK